MNECQENFTSFLEKHFHIRIHKALLISLSILTKGATINEICIFNYDLENAQKLIN